MTGRGCTNKKTTMNIADIKRLERRHHIDTQPIPFGHRLTLDQRKCLKVVKRKHDWDVLYPKVFACLLQYPVLSIDLEYDQNLQDDGHSGVKATRYFLMGLVDASAVVLDVAALSGERARETGGEVKTLHEVLPPSFYEILRSPNFYLLGSDLMRERSRDWDPDLFPFEGRLVDSRWVWTWAATRGNLIQTEASAIRNGARKAVAFPASA